jgi:CRP-like cAMP-binding protein
VDRPRDIKRRLKELAAALREEPGSIPKRLELAAALRESGRPADAIELYRGVAEVYAEDGRLVQAMAVCKGILDIDPAHRDTLEMLATLAARREHGRRSSPILGSSEPLPVEGEPVSGPVASAAGEAEADEPLPEQAPDVTRVGRRVTQPYPIARPPATYAPIVEGDDGDTVIDKAAGGRLDTDRMTAPTDEEIAALHDAELARRSARTLDTLRMSAPPVEIGFGDEDSAVQMVNAVIDGPFPRPILTSEPPPFPLLSDLPRAAFVELLARLSVVRLDAGETVLREGEAGDACYLIAAGQVRVTKAGVEVAQLGAGSFFGEFAVLADQRRHASVETLEPTELLEIRRELIDELVAAHPGVARTLRAFYRERLLQTLLATAPFFQRLMPEERAGIAERFRPRRFGRGAHIIEEGAPGGGLYLILVGEVEVVRAGKPDAEGKPQLVKLGTLGEGSYFGEMSLLRGGVASATVRATRMTEAVQLPPRDFYELASQHPVLWEQLRSEAERRELANHAILAGEARKSDTFYLV